MKKRKSAALGPLGSADEAARISRQLGRRLRLANYQVPAAGAPRAPSQQAAATPAEPCAVATAEKKLFELDIDLSVPEGQMPTDFAAACWDSMNYPGSPFAMIRCWPGSTYYWDSTCLCHRPLYFEEINLERYGYGCYACLQPAASAAHFFGTVPALPYLVTIECPHECVYTLGHYRPGSCPPLRCHWPPCSPLAAAAEGGVITGMIFLIP